MQSNEGGATRAGLLTAAACTAVIFILFFGFHFTETPPHWEIAPEANLNFTLLALFLERGLYVVLAAAVLAAAASAGLFIMARLRLGGERPLERAVVAAALGLGVLSLVTLALGALGILGTWTAVAVLACLAALGARHSAALVRQVAQHRDNPFSPMEKCLAAFAGAAALLVLMYAFNPPMNFDALEYHLGAPARYFNSGAIGYIEYNVYSNFPANSEMLYLFSMALTGSKTAGAMAGKVLNALVAFVAAGGAYCLGRWLRSRGAGIFAAAALLTMGGFFQVATGVYVEGLQALYTVVAVLAAGRFLSRGPRGWVVISGLAAGLAFGVKYPAAVFVAAPLAAAVFLAPGAAGERFKAFAIFCLAALAPALPWLAKNLILTGNPVYPLLYSIFGGRDWSALQDARWAMAHTPKGALGWQQWARHIFGMFFGEAHGRISLMAFAFAPLALAGRGRTKRVLFALGFAALYVLLWFAFTHRIERFLVPALAVTAAVSGAGLFSVPPGRLRKALMGAALFLAGLSLFYTAGFYGAKPDPSVPLFGRYDEFMAENHAAYSAWKRAGDVLEPGALVYLHGEAETFYIDFDFRGTTVFDRKPLEETAREADAPEDAAAALAQRGFTHIFVNWATFRRQQETYRFTFEGKEYPGYSALTGPDFFEALESAGVVEEVFAEGPQVYPDAPACVLYRIKP